MKQMSTPVVPVYVTASWAALAGVLRVYVDHLDATLNGLVLDEPAKLPKSPRVLNETLFLGYADTLSDMTQVFHHDNVTGFTRSDDSLGDPMVEIGHPAALPTRQPFQEALGPLRALGLERTPQSCVSPSNMHSLSPRKLQASSGSSKVIDASVNAYNVAISSWRSNFSVDHDVDIELSRLLVVAKSS
jgi:hypothetical protein